jgi:phage terminase large subunit-like protein
MAANLVVERDAAGNLKSSNSKSTERIDGMVAAIMALTRITARTLRTRRWY